MTHYLLSLFMFACCVCRAAETNMVYPIDDGMLVSQNAKGDIKLSRTKVEAAKKIKECLPAAEYPEGNWGSVVGGFQLSLTFETNTFNAGCPVEATIIVRNVTNSILSYRAVGVFGRASLIPVVVTDNAGGQLPLKSDELTVISIHEPKIFPGTEQKFHERIDNLYKLPTNSVIAIYAQLRVGHTNGIDVRSAKVSLSIQ